MYRVDIVTNANRGKFDRHPHAQRASGRKTNQASAANLKGLLTHASTASELQQLKVCMIFESRKSLSEFPEPMAYSRTSLYPQTFYFLHSPL
ncbi:hypothetical protein [Paraburkholderia pallida]|uniref:Uncharacterized protein n=1 Tax=Paraburkholderia pallida TaxID=2547399 RepID=A0A4P7D7J3_9BURK|nr:hypothetical protein [Paraburkholderia pallida]QBR02925.1 hypothetical protein E1956_37635 [Paraburkholderia pallida]